MDSPQEGGVDICNRQRKFGLPGWMMNNIERLNFVTDFEQYACSPPETEGFLTECMENSDRPHDFPDNISTIEPMDIHVKPKSDAITDSESISSPSPMLSTAERITPQYHLLMSNMKHEELFSSPDTTPCATPEPSPVIRRKVSIPHPGDTVQTNPGRWFYMGKFKKPDSGCKQSIIADNDKENKTGLQQDTGALKGQDSVFNSKRPAIQLVISNFDLNAVSPNSW